MRWREEEPERTPAVERNLQHLRQHVACAGWDDANHAVFVYQQTGDEVYGSVPTHDDEASKAVQPSASSWFNRPPHLS